MSDFKETLCTGSPGVNHPLRDPLPVEVGDLLDQMVVLKKDRTCQIVFKKKKNIASQMMNMKNYIRFGIYNSRSKANSHQTSSKKPKLLSS